MYPTTNIYHRVFNVLVADGPRVLDTGTMFVVEVDNREYCITARHIAEHIGGEGIKILRNDEWVSHPAIVVGHGEAKVDVSVIALRDVLVPNDGRFPLPLSSEGIIFGQEVMFLGFPDVYKPAQGLKLHSGFPLPLVKYARLSTTATLEYPMWLDGHNNRGFSGSPLCFTPNRPNEVCVAGVVTAYQGRKEPVYTENDEDTYLHILENTGLILAWDIKHALNLIRNNPIGAELH